MTAKDWLLFLRQYGPVPRNDNMYDETIQRSAERTGIPPVLFEHPAQDQVLACFDQRSTDPATVILTGTAGDGKTHLCRQVWMAMRGNPAAWGSDSPYLSLKYHYPKDRTAWPAMQSPELFREVTIHFIRDLSGWAPQQSLPWDEEKQSLLHRLCVSLFDGDASEVFLIAANDGQLIECWRRLSDTPSVIKARALLERLLVEDRQQEPGARLRMFNLSRWDSAEIFDRAYEALMGHPGWKTCDQETPGENQPFGPKCPIRHNVELLKTSLVRSRLRSLIQLCDFNGLHLPIRQLLLLLSNAILGHPDCNDHLMRPSDVQKLIRSGTVSKANLYNNILGGNLSDIRRQSITVFDYFDRFQLGYETSNRVDNILIFGEGDPQFGTLFDALVRSDSFYGADEAFFAARNGYIEGGEDDEKESKEFLEMLVAQRRSLFFRIPDDLSEKLYLWELTVFRFAGEYLSQVTGALRSGTNVRRPIVNRLIKGLNRIFTGMLINTERELLLATSGNYSQAKISRLLIDRISVEARHGERVSLGLNPSGRAALTVHLSDKIQVGLELNLIRYEFLSRIATEGALPASFSKECYEDLLAFKTRLLSAHVKRRESEVTVDANQTLGLRILNVSPQGLPEDRFVEVIT
jgi:hypothetical protein